MLFVLSSLEKEQKASLTPGQQVLVNEHQMNVYVEGMIRDHSISIRLLNYSQSWILRMSRFLVKYKE